MRKNKTAKKNRDTYTYYFHDCKACITSDMVGVSDELLALLHDMDDQEFDNDRCERRSGRSISLDCIPADDDAQDKATMLIDPNIDVEAACIEHAMLQAAMALLTPDQREIVRMRVELDYTQAKIADILGISEYAVRERIFRIKNKLKKLF